MAMIETYFPLPTNQPTEPDQETISQGHRFVLLVKVLFLFFGVPMMKGKRKVCLNSKLLVAGLMQS